MFESVKNYLDSYNLRYRYGDNLYEIEWEDDGSCSAFCRGWSIKLNPELAETEELAGEEWVDVKYQFRGIEDDALFQQLWIELKQELVGYKYDNITMFDKFTNAMFTGTPQISIMVCLSDADTPADEALDNTFVMLADLIQKMMARYEAAYLHLDPERENGPYSEQTLTLFTHHHMHHWVTRILAQEYHIHHITEDERKQIDESMEMLSKQEKTDLIAEFVTNGYVTSHAVLERLGICDPSLAEIHEKAMNAALENKLYGIDKEDIRQFVYKIMKEDR